MLFDERELSVFDNNESRTYFKEILQSYYSQNYRATIVLLYSFVIYDLFVKLQTMASEGDKKANDELNKINALITNDEKYSIVENTIIKFYKDNCPLYFNRFLEDVEYLKNCRNKCAHLKVNDNSLYVPSDYHARMLICSMYDNILSVKAPFIMDLFSYAQSDVELYSSRIPSISYNGLDEAIILALKEKYLKRMTYDSLKKSYKTFARLLFVSDNEDCKKNLCGLYVFTYAMTDHIIKNGYMKMFSEEDIQSVFGKIEVVNLENSKKRTDALISLMVNFPAIMDLIRTNDLLFLYTSKCVLSNPYNLYMYKTFYPRTEKSIYVFFMENSELKQPSYIEELYKNLKDCDDFSIDEFMIEMVSNIPSYYGYYSADCFMTSFISHLDDMSIDSINRVIKLYNINPQCTGRNRHKNDMEIINKYLDDHNQGENDS